MSKSDKIAAGSAGVIAIAITFTPIWEGIWTTAKVDTIGTGHPVTYCYGQTSEFGKVAAGQKFTVEECKQKLAESLPKYLAAIEPCIKVPLPSKTKAALLDAAYNAGSAAVCRSPMVAKMNAGDIRGGCAAFDGWYVRASGRVVQGLINRRSGDKTRKGEKELCLEGLNEPVIVAPTSIPAQPAKPPKHTLWFYVVKFFTGK
jgi:lysozyme